MVIAETSVTAKKNALNIGFFRLASIVTTAKRFEELQETEEVSGYQILIGKV